MKKEYEVFGIGNILVDHIAEVDDSTLEKFNLKKGIMHEKSIEIINDLESKLENIQKYQGGTVPNVIHGLTNLGHSKSALAGVIAKDEDGDFFVKELEKMGIKNCLVEKKGNTGVSLSLITPDGERTFVTNYGITSDYRKDDIDKKILKSSKCFHFSGYEFESMNKTIKKAVKLAKKYKTKVSFDLGDPDLVLRKRKNLEKLLKKVDIVFANEEEAKNFARTDNPEKALEILSNYCEIAVVKLGGRGAIAKSGNNVVKAEGYTVKHFVNTIGAGDGFAAGFLCGFCGNRPLQYNCNLGNLYASKIVQEQSANLSYRLHTRIFKS